MKNPCQTSFIVALTILAQTVLQVSGRPLRPREEEWKTPGNRQEQRCNLDKAGTEWFLFNSKGKPGPEDIMPSTDPKLKGLPNDLSSLTLMRSVIELDATYIEQLLPFVDKNGSNINWKTTCEPPKLFTFNTTVGFLSKEPAQVTSFSIFGNKTDAAKGSVWPTIIQDNLLRRLTVNDERWDNVVYEDRLGRPGTWLTHSIEGLNGNSTRRMAEILWNEGLGKPGKAVTTDLGLNAQGETNSTQIDEIINIIRNASAPALMATKGNLQESIESDTMYTLVKSESGGLLGRNARAQPGESRYEREIGSLEIAKNAKFLTYFVQ